jgi:hypothetical protein
LLEGPDSCLYQNFELNLYPINHKLKLKLMILLAAQIANNTPNESSLMIIGVTACIISIVLLLWKNEAKTTI